ncbi:MAG: hypothetical protein WBB67_09060 [bacterium]
MNKSQRLFSVLLLAILVIGLTECCSTKLGCHKYETGSNLSVYCNNHRDAVAKFIRLGETNSEQTVRLRNFREFYALIKNCKTPEDIKTYINNNTTLPGFRELYEIEHQFAEQETNINSALKAEVILCGFKHAIDAFEKNLAK